MKTAVGTFLPGALVEVDQPARRPLGLTLEAAQAQAARYTRGMKSAAYFLLALGVTACSQQNRVFGAGGAGGSSISTSTTVGAGGTGGASASSSSGASSTAASSGASSTAASSGASSTAASSGTSSTAASSTAGSSSSGVVGGFAPTDLPGLSVWLDAMVGITYDAGNRVLVWGDRSGNANNAAPSSCTGPLRAAASLNGRDTLVFDGAADCLRIADATSVQFAAGDFAVFVVLRYANAPVFGNANAIASFWAKRIVGGNYAGVSMFGNTISPATTGKLELRQTNVTGNIATGATNNLNDNMYRRLGVARRGSTLEVYVNGALDGSQATTVIDVGEPGRPVWLGGEPDQGTSGTNWMVGNLAEVVAVKGSLTDAQIASLDAYLKSKYGL